MSASSSWIHAAVVCSSILALAWCGNDVVLPETYDEFRVACMAAGQQVLDVVVDPFYFSSVRAAAVNFGTHGWTAAVSGGELLYLLLWPVTWCVAQFCRAAVLGFYEFVICRGIASPAAVAQMKAVGLAIIDWQLRRTWREIAMQVAGIVTITGLYFLLRFLTRRRYFERVERWIRGKRRDTWMWYRAQLQRLAQVSVVLAIMTPHAMFLLMTGGFNLMFPRFCRWIAVETKLVSVPSLLYPLIASILLLFDLWKAEKDGTERDVSRRRKNKRKSLVGALRKTKASDTAASLENQREYLIRYWIVRSGVKLFKLFFRNLPFATACLQLHPIIVPLLYQTELLFWVWIVLVPKITPTVLESYQPYRTPVDYLAVAIVGKSVSALYSGFESIVPERIWTNYVLKFVDTGTTVLSMMGMLSQPSKDALVAFVRESRSLCIPIILACAWPTQNYAIMFAALCLPIAKSFASQTLPQRDGERTEYHWLQTWILHVGLSLVIDYLKLFWSWIPLAAVPVFVLYAYLSLAPAKSVDAFYRDWVQEELQIMCILPQTEEHAQKSSKVAALVVWVIDRLPKATDANGAVEVVQEHAVGLIEQEQPDVRSDDEQEDDDMMDVDFQPDPPSEDDEIVVVEKSSAAEPAVMMVPSEEKENAQSNAPVRRRSTRRRRDP